MITIMLLLIALCIIGLLVLIVGGLLAIAWPIAVILVLGILIDGIVIKNIFKKKK